MAGTGPPPAEKKRRRNADPYEDMKVTVPAAGSPASPSALPGADGFSEQTRAWYRTWCSAPQAKAFTVTDWQRLHMLAHLVDAFFARPTKELMGEIRLNESLLGATHADRLRGRIKVEGEESSEPSDSAAKDEVAAKRRQRMKDAS